jgi:hypothetical protein
MRFFQLSRSLRSLALVAGASVLALSLAGGAEARRSAGSGCTRSNVYWSHAIDDPAWDSVIPDGPYTIFFLSGRNYHQMLTDSTHSSPYNELALDYIAATLNVYAGASMPSDVLVAFIDAQSLFMSYAPTYDFITDPDGVTANFEDLRSILALYNSGKLGPGACSGRKR